MSASKAQRAATAERRGKAVAFRLAGLDFETIAQRLGYDSRGAACKDITRALEANLAEQGRHADVLREQELLRLDRLQAGLWGSAIGGNPRAVDSVLRLMDRRAKYLGLDAPMKHEVFTYDGVEAEIARLSAELGRVEAPAVVEAAELAG